jgi:hypothetical protein
MTTTNDGGPAHPMVMKAADVICEIESYSSILPKEKLWGMNSLKYTHEAKKILTECGALECLKALIHVHDNLGGGGADEWVVMEDFDIQIVEDAINSAGIEI